MSLVEAAGLRWILLFLLSVAVPLQGQDDLANQALDLMRANRFQDAEVLWRQLPTGKGGQEGAAGREGVGLQGQREHRHLGPTPAAEVALHEIGTVARRLRLLVMVAITTAMAITSSTWVRMPGF